MLFSVVDKIKSPYVTADPMPLESLDYDVFDYKHSDEDVLSLEEAAKKADQLRLADASNFYRVRPVDSKMSSFRVEEVPKERVYVDALVRWSNLLNKLIFRTR